MKKAVDTVNTQEIKRLAFDALDIQVYANPDNLQIKGAVPLELVLLPLHERWDVCPLMSTRGRYLLASL